MSGLDASGVAKAGPERCPEQTIRARQRLVAWLVACEEAPVRDPFPVETVTSTDALPPFARAVAEEVRPWRQTMTCSSTSPLARCLCAAVSVTTGGLGSEDGPWSALEQSRASSAEPGQAGTSTITAIALIAAPAEIRFLDANTILVLARWKDPLHACGHCASAKGRLSSCLTQASLIPVTIRTPPLGGYLSCPIAEPFTARG